jgi:hypothetical protein
MTNDMQFAPKGTLADDALAAGFVLVKCSSHRSREKLLGRNSGAQGYWSWQRSTGHGVYAVRPDMLPRKGVTRLRGPFDDMAMCW